MSAQPVRNYTWVAAAIVVAAIVLSATALTYSSFEATVTRTTTLTSTFVQTTHAYCVQTGIHGSLFVRVVTDNTNSPIGGDNVTVTILNYCGSEQRVPLGDTNSTGYTPSPANWTGVLLVNVTNVFAKTTYTFLAQTSGAVSLATLSLPSGLTVIRPIACYSVIGPAVCSNTTITSTAYVGG